MKRVAPLWIVLAFAFGQPPNRDDYRNAYRDWRQADPDLERDAAAAAPELASRAEKAAAQALKYGAARRAFLQALADETGQVVAALESGAAPADIPAAATKTVQDYLTLENAVLGRNIEAFANDPDRGIQQLRQALERERTVLGAITPAMADRQKAADAASQAADAAQQVLLKTLDQYQALAAGWKQTLEQTDRETAAWAVYYPALVAGPQNTAVQPAAPPSSTGGQAAPVAARAPEPAPAVRTPSVTPVSLARYVGAWAFPASGGVFHGAQPEFVDLAVHEENGHATGTLFARFKLPPGSAGDPELRLDFAGDFTNSRTQRLNLQTGDGATGVIELIPGPAFNLLEVNFQTNAPSGKVRRGNFVLLKR